ncbi:MAG: hypothetical protein QXO75_07830 [Nitrososphaerota archaeon]
MGYVQEIGEKEKVEIARSEYIAKKPRYVGVEGVGTFATQISAKIMNVVYEFAATKFFQHALALDNNMDSVNKAVLAASKLKPGFRLFKSKDSFKGFFFTLPGLKGSIGFNRSLDQSTEAMPKYYGTIRRSVAMVNEHDKKCGTQLSMQIRPLSVAGGHAGSPQWLLNLELKSMKLDAFKIGLVAIPDDITSINVFRRIFPLMNGMGNYGLDCLIIWDNSKATLERSVAEQDEIVVRGLLTTFTAFTYDPSLPGPGDIWSSLTAESPYIGVAGVREPLAIAKKMFGKVSDREAVIEAVRRGMLRVIEDKRSMLVDAKISKGLPSIVAVSGNIGFEEFREAVGEILKPRNLTVIFSPSSDDSVTVTRFFPLNSYVNSINRIFRLGRTRPANSLLVPQEVVEEAIEHAWIYVEKTADFIGVEPEELLKG